jgi:hypothetical protein
LERRRFCRLWPVQPSIQGRHPVRAYATLRQLQLAFAECCFSDMTDASLTPTPPCGTDGWNLRFGVLPPVEAHKLREEVRGEARDLARHVVQRISPQRRRVLLHLLLHTTLSTLSPQTTCQARNTAISCGLRDIALAPRSTVSPVVPIAAPQPRLALVVQRCRSRDT